MSPVLYCSVVIVNYSFTGISGCLEFELEVSLVAWIRLGGCCLVYSPILRSRRSQILGFRSLDYQIQEDTRLAILLVKYRSLSYLDYTPLGAQKSCSVYTNIKLILICNKCYQCKLVCTGPMTEWCKILMINTLTEVNRT